MEILKSFTNTDSEDFEGMFHGEVYSVKAGESKIYTEKLAKHLAEQLAYKIMVRRGIDKISAEEKAALPVSFVGNVEIPPTPVKAEKPVIAEKPKEEEFADIKPQRKPRAKKK